MESTVWISYDLGVNGDYDGLYSWLDGHRAKECGSGIAYLTYTHSGDLMKCLADEINGTVKLDKRSRIYVVRKDDGRIKGRFLVGRRKAPPWEGFGDINDDSEDAA